MVKILSYHNVTYHTMIHHIVLHAHSSLVQLHDLNTCQYSQYTRAQPLHSGIDAMLAGDRRHPWWCMRVIALGISTGAATELYGVIPHYYGCA